jgi:uncharacterized protein (TIGR04255 family)
MRSEPEIHANTTAALMPDFDDPPVVETFLSISFRDLEKWGIPHYGLYWDKIRSEYPKFELRPPVLGQIETFGDSAENADAVFELSLLNQPPIRIWFVHSKANRLIQLQSDRFVFNWRKIGAEEKYPKFDEAIRGEFQKEWIRFGEFLESQSIPVPVVTQCEISYVNHIPGSSWTTFKSIVSALAEWPGNKGTGFLPVPEDLQFNTRYVMAGHGRLHVQLQPAIRNFDGKRVSQLTLTARGKPSSSATEALMRWFDIGREWIVRGFADFTSEEMHKLWRRRR